MIEDITARIANAYAQKIDEVVIAMLERNGVKEPYNPVNLLTQGYRLEAETLRITPFDTRTTYRLVKVLDEENILVTSKIAS